MLVPGSGFGWKPESAKRFMRRIDKIFSDKIKGLVAGKDVLEIGCGDGTHLHGIVPTLKSLTGIDTSLSLINKANQKKESSFARFFVGSAEELDFPDEAFCLAIFTLSFHHIPFERMNLAIDEALRVVKKGGLIIFVEPTNEGSFIDAEMRYGCCDGDERRQKAFAYFSMLSACKMREVEEFESEAIFDFDSKEDFLENIATISGTVKDIVRFLEFNGYRLRAKRRVNVFQAV